MLFSSTNFYLHIEGRFWLLSHFNTSRYAVSMSIRPFTSRILAGQHSRVALSSQAASRAFSGSSLRAYPRVDSQDRESINTEATEYSKSASDHESAHQADAAFDPALTDPQEQKEVAGKNTGVSISQHDCL